MYTEPAILLTPNDDFISLVGYHALENNRLIIGYKDNKIQLEVFHVGSSIRNLHKDYLQSLQWGTMVAASPMTEVTYTSF